MRLVYHYFPADTTVTLQLRGLPEGTLVGSQEGMQAQPHDVRHATKGGGRGEEERWPSKTAQDALHRLQREIQGRLARGRPGMSRLWIHNMRELRMQ